MSYSHKHYVIQLILLIGWFVLMSLTYSSIVQSQGFGCPYYKYEAYQPGWSWPQHRTVTVYIDSLWDPDDRASFAEGNLKWSGAPNCSDVHFVGFSAKTFTTEEYSQDAPSDTIYWMRADPLKIRR